jgi:uncharacterized protein (DUF39 family)
VLEHAAVKDEDILAPVVDYAHDYPNAKFEPLAYVSYAQLKSGAIVVRGQKIQTGSLSSLRKAYEIADTLKKWINAGKFFLSEPVAKLPGAGSDYKFKALKERPL